MAKIKISRSERILQVKAPYHPELARRARDIGGVWVGEAWAFEATSEESVRKLYKSIYGSFEESPD